MTPVDPCARLHDKIRKLDAHVFAAEKGRLPLNGVYVLFERGELGHGGDAGRPNWKSHRRRQSTEPLD